MSRLLVVVIIFLLLIFVGFKIFLIPQLEVATGYAAKKMCSCYYMDNRAPARIQEEDLNMPFIDKTTTLFNEQDSSARSTFFGLAGQTAQYKGGLGCVLLQGKDDFKVYLPLSGHSAGLPTPKADSIYYDNKGLQNAFDIAFQAEHKTRALVVLHKGKIVAEKYASGFDSSSVFNGWSMTKSITATLIGILVQQGKLSLEETNLFPQWKDQRSTISLKDLLQMQSGLYFEEKYDEISTATNMLFRSERVSAIPLKQKMIHKPGSFWYYSSGTSNLLSELLRQRIGKDAEYHRFPYDSLFSRIDMNSAVLETDESGTFVGSSFCYATARDWARFGQLYLQNGSWNGESIVDSSWVEFVKKPAAHSNGLYGGHFWLNANGAAFPQLPHNMFSCNGFQGQRVFIFPNQQLVVVRLGLSENWNFQEMLMDILKALSVPHNPTEIRPND